MAEQEKQKEKKMLERGLLRAKYHSETRNIMVDDVRNELLILIPDTKVFQLIKDYILPKFWVS